jgi:hypothetical protein
MWIFITLLLVLLIAVRVSYIKILFDDWNYWLAFFIKKERLNPDHGSQRMEYLKSAHLKVSKYWWRVGRWTIKDFISNPLLIHDVRSFTKDRY